MKRRNLVALGSTLRSGVRGAANVASELGLTKICWLATQPLGDAPNTLVDLDEQLADQLHGGGEGIPLPLPNAVETGRWGATAHSGPGPPHY